MSVSATMLEGSGAGTAGQAIRRAARRRGSFGSLVLLIIGLLLGLLAQIYLLRRQYPLDGAIFYILAMLIFYRAVRGLSDAVTFPLAMPAVYTLRRAVPAAVLGLAALYLFWTRNNNPAIILTLVATAALVLAYWKEGLNESGKVRLQRWEGLALGGILLLALFMRVYRLSAFPATLYLDEGDFGTLALNLVRGKTYTPFVTEFTGHPTLWFYGLGVFLKIVGIGIASSRIYTIAIGLLAIVAAYFLGRELLGPRGALLAAFFMAIAMWHNTFSRIVFTGSAVPLFVALAMLFLLRGLRTAQPLDFVWSGIAVGWGMSTYLAFRVVPVLIAMYLLYKVIGNRSFLKTHLPGLALFALAAIISFTPLGVYYLHHPSDFMSRTQAASVFLDIEREKSNAPLYANIRKAFGMFNYQGDPRPRHNLPHNPMVDPITGIFLALGFGYIVLRWRKAENSMLVTWLALGMLPGVLSLADSNPHSLRTITNLPAVFLIAGLGAERAITFVSANFSASAAQRAWAAAAALGIAAMLLNFNISFNRQPNDRSVYYDFDPVQNTVALETAKLSETKQVYVAAQFTNHSAVKFLCDGKPYQTFNQTQHLPLRDVGAKDVVFLLEPVQRQLLTLFQTYYPEAQVSSFIDKYGNLGYYRVSISREQVARAQGVTASYYRGSDRSVAPAIQRGEETVSGNWATAPIEPPFTVVWRSALYVPRYGPHVLTIDASEQTTVSLDGQTALETAGGAKSANITLYGGFHSLEVVATASTRSGSVTLRWKTPDGQETVIPRSNLFALDIASNGLLGKYYRGNAWSGSPAILQKDLFVFPNDLLPAPFSIEWEGKLYAPQDGQYAFGSSSDDGSLLYIDNKLVVDNGGHHSERYVEGRVNLTQGLHDLRLRYFQDDGGRTMELYWIPPGGRKDMVPSNVLFPPGTVISGPLDIVLIAPELTPLPPAAPQPSGTTSPVRPSAPGGPRVGELGPILTFGREGSGQGEFRNPRGVAVDGEGNIYVADTGNRRVQKFDRTGKFVAEWKGGSEPFIEPVAIAVAPNGEIFVLEPEKDGAHRFTARGEYRGKVGDGLGLYRPRGMSIDKTGTLFFANTGGNTIVRANAGGLALGIVGSAGERDGQLEQPTDVAVDAQGNIYVTDTYNQRVQRFTPDGRYAGKWSIPASGTLLGPHLTIGPDGAVYVSDPDNHLINAYSADGAVLATWGGQGNAEGQLSSPVGLFMDSSGLLYIADSANHRIQVWGKR